MRMKKPFLSLLTVVGLSVSLLAGCGNGSEIKSTTTTGGSAAASSDPVKFNFYFTGSQNVKDLWDSLEPMFEKQHPDIDVNLVYIPSGTGAEPTYDRIVAAKKAGKGSGDIDLYEDGITSVAQGTKDGVWEQLNEKDIPNLSKVNTDTMKDVDNFAVPYRSSAVVLAYDSSKISNPPTTLDELLQWIKANPEQFAYNDPSTGGSGSSFVQTIVYKDLPEEDIHNSDPAIMEKWDGGFDTLKEIGPYVYGGASIRRKTRARWIC